MRSWRPRSRLPAKPTGFSAVGSGNGRVTLSWDNPDNPSITGWQYRKKYTRRMGGARLTSWDLEWTPIPDSDATTTRYEVTGLDNSTVYTFIIRARNANRFGLQSDERTATHRRGVIASPIGLSAKPGNGRVVLSWGNPKGTRSSTAGRCAGENIRRSRMGHGSLSPGPPGARARRSQVTP